VAKFRKKPVVIEAVQYNNTDPKHYGYFNLEEVLAFGEGKIKPDPNGTVGLVIATLEGDMFVTASDWVIKGVNGEFYPCKPDIFEKTYDAVREVAHYPDGMGEESRRLHREYNALVAAQRAGAKNGADVVRLTDEAAAKGIILVPNGENL
jgi:hypothetical protein